MYFPDIDIIISNKNILRFSFKSTDNFGTKIY